MKLLEEYRRQQPTPIADQDALRLRNDSEANNKKILAAPDVCRTARMKWIGKLRSRGTGEAMRDVRIPFFTTRSKTAIFPFCCLALLYL